MTPTASHQKKLLALLLLYSNQVVSISSIEREIWAGDRPRTALTAIQTYIVNLRKAFAAALGISVRDVAKTMLVTYPGGYSLALEEDESDIHRFERLARLGSRAITDGALSEGACLLRKALLMHRGPVLADVRAGVLIEPQVARLTELMVNSLSQRIEADIALGRHYEVLGQLADLVQDYPWHENLRIQHLLALYYSGRRAEALSAYQRFRRSLIDELGLTPLPKLERLHQGMLRSEPWLDDRVDVARYFRSNVNCEKLLT